MRRFITSVTTFDLISLRFFFRPNSLRLLEKMGETMTGLRSFSSVELGSEKRAKSLGADGAFRRQ